jgi:hypothetical protein
MSAIGIGLLDGCIEGQSPASLSMRNASARVNVHLSAAPPSTYGCAPSSFAYYLLVVEPSPWRCHQSQVITGPLTRLSA